MMILSFSSSSELAAAKGNACPGIQRDVYEGLSAQGQWLLRAIKRTEEAPHAAEGSNGLVNPAPMY